MVSFLKKDILVLIRDKSGLLILLLMPFVLTAILGFSLQGIMESDSQTLTLELAIVIEDEVEQGIAQFSAELDHYNLADDTKEQLKATAMSSHPFLILESMLDSGQVSEIVKKTEMTAEEAERALDNEDVMAILTIPEGFTYQSLEKMLLNQGEGQTLDLTVIDYRSLGAKIISNILDNFTRSLNFETAIAHASNGNYVPGSGDNVELGGIETVTAGDPIDSLAYYTLAMAVMFALYAASATSERALLEKKQQAFNRILLSGKHPFVYLLGKFFATTLVVCLQMLILFSLSALLFNSFTFHSLEFVTGMFIIIGVFSLCVGSVATLLTSLTLRFTSASISNVFSAGIVSLLAFAGGSFFPVSGVLQTVGEWTPNGAALTSFLLWMQGVDQSLIISPLAKVMCMTILFFTISLVVFPKRRSATS
ncbi:ABC transporter permease [Salipaludibacillus sp. LMS25]|jgi:ABC-2 type transport system permease protein|uniref:ABC transporter permease n=1 Tax=Salipaludibacillus sp. LMS25 TaxID=2924031 RepID=UPI0020D10429|nr:ABC transporter permease [Salipaludibacillus sp. LMS25]UTR13152.1 ABC transporter permease [Salipaludibacillus sp. LMS25]